MYPKPTSSDYIFPLGEMYVCMWGVYFAYFGTTATGNNNNNNNHILITYPSVYLILITTLEDQTYLPFYR